MTADIQLYREDTGEMAVVRVVDGHQPTRADRRPTHMDVWDAIERRAADQFAAWVEGETARAKAEMRALCDELGLPRTWAVPPEEQVPGPVIRRELPGPTHRNATAETSVPPDPVQAYFDADDPDERPGRAVPDRYDPALAAQARAALTEQARRQDAIRQAAEQGTATGQYVAPALNPRYRGPRSRIGRWADETLKRPGQWWRARKAATDKRMGVAE